MESLKEQLNSLNQDHVFKFYEELSPEERSKLVDELNEIDWEHLCQVYREQVQVKQSKIEDDLLKPLLEDCIEGTSRCEHKLIEKYRTIGMTCIGQGKVAALLLAGGQGTRLGVDYPKGMYDVGINKSLFQLQAERILKLSEPLEMATGQKNQIIWYIMTSESTMDMTRDYFEAHNYFGLDKNAVIFFEQNTLPCFDLRDGKVLMAAKNKLCRSPDGNGGLYEALHKKGIIDHMLSHGVEFVHAYCVDNILVRVCDPTFMGYCISKLVDAGAKVVEKVIPNEAVGTICKVKDKFKVIEYSEISDLVAQKRDELGKLVFNAGNICEHFFRVDFLNSIKADKRLPYHIARKKIPHISLATGELVKPSEPNGVKLEKFVFDVFEFTDKFAAWEVRREDEFSPLKNGEGSEKDNPTTALKALKRAYELKFF